MAETYRSYVVRVRRPAMDVEAVQIDVEDLIGGRRVAVNGDEARALADRLRSLVIGPIAATSAGRRTSPRGSG
jgi:hypothetical protein